MPVATDVRGHFDAFEAAGGDVVVELDAGHAPEVAGDELRDRLPHDQADGLFLVSPDQGAEGGLDPFQGGGGRLPLGGADGAGGVGPLPDDLEVAPLDLVELGALPEPLVEVAEVVDPPGSEPEGLAYALGRPDGALAGA